MAISGRIAKYTPSSDPLLTSEIPNPSTVKAARPTSNAVRPAAIPRACASWLRAGCCAAVMCSARPSSRSSRPKATRSAIPVMPSTSLAFRLAWSCTRLAEELRVRPCIASGMAMPQRQTKTKSARPNHGLKPASRMQPRLTASAAATGGTSTRKYRSCSVSMSAIILVSRSPL